MNILFIKIEKSGDFMKKIKIMFSVITMILIVILASCTRQDGGQSNHIHTYSEAYSCDKEKHWYDDTCGHNTKKDIKAHTYSEWVITKEATETEKGSKKRTCTVCGYVDTQEIAVLTHTHTYSIKWTYDVSSHWHSSTCEHDMKSDIENHTYGEWIIEKEATVDEVGSKYRLCSVCRYKESQEISLLASHTIVWKNYDGTILETDRVLDNTIPSYNDINPYRKDDNTYTYTFAGWDKEIVPATQDEVYTATYTKNYINYTVAFKDYDGTVLSTKTYHYGETVSTPSNPTRASNNMYTYEFAGWDKEVVTATKDEVYTATYTKNYINYTVAFKDYDGTVLSTKTYHYGETVSTPSNPTRASNNMYTYEFAGWDKEVVTATKDEVYTATYTSTYIDYTIKFVNDDNTVISTNTYHYGDSVIEPGTPIKPGNEKYTYTFIGWDKIVSTVTEDTTYQAKYDTNINKYKITWKNYDDTILKVDIVEYGNLPVYSGDTPYKNCDSKYNYIFKGFSPEIENAYKDAIYIASFEKELATTYTIIYNANGGTGAPNNQIKENGKSINLSLEEPVNDDHLFVGWSCAYDGIIYKAGSTFEVNANVTLYAAWGHQCSTCEGTGSIITTYTCTSCSGTGYSGTSKAYVNCSKCGGTGSTTTNTTSICSSCKGYGGDYLCECSCGRRWWASQTGSKKCSSCGKIVSGQLYTTCSKCSGSGSVKTTVNNTCSSCYGAGSYEITVRNKCVLCNGAGKITETKICQNCSGNTYILELYDSNDLTLYDGSVIIDKYTATINSPYKLMVPNKNGYTFLGWFDKLVNGNQYTDAQGVCLNVWNENKNINLYACWSLNVYTITYDCDDEVNLEGMPSTYTVEDLEISLNVKNKDYYNFEWKIDDNIITKIDTSMAKDIIIVGRYSPIVYAIKYNLDGGNLTNKTSYNVETDTFSINAPIKTGYTFLGWTGSNGETPQKEIIIEKGSNGDLSYTANYKINQYTIKYKTNGGLEIESEYLSYDSLITAKAICEGKSFVGWFDETLTTEYVRVPSYDVTLYAKWGDYEVTLNYSLVSAIKYTDLITPELFNATAVDTDHNSITVTATLIGDLTSGNTVSVKLIAIGLYDIYDTYTIKNIKVYGTPTITYDTSKDYINLSDVLKATLFNAEANDTFGESLDVNVTIKEENYNAGDLVTIVFSTIDIAGNTYTIEVPNILVYGNPTITRDETILSIKESDEISNELFNITALDSFNQELSVTTSIKSGTQRGGNNITIESVVTDSKGNTNIITFNIKVYGTPTISDTSIKNFKVEDEITLETLGVTALDSFNETLTNVTLTLQSGEQAAGETLTYLVIATDSLGNVTTKEITNIRIYGIPTITYNTELDKINSTDTIDSSLFSAQAVDTFGAKLSITVSLNSGIFAGGNEVTYKLSATDSLGNTCEVITRLIKVYSSSDITLTYSKSESSIKATSSGEEFSASATNSFGDVLSTKIEAATGFELKGGNTISLFIVATDMLGNTKKSEIITNIKIYENLHITYLYGSNYIMNTDDVESLFVVKDDFNKELLFEVEIVSGSLDNETITYKLTSTDRTGNIIEQEFTFDVLTLDESILDLFRNGTHVGTQRVNKDSSYTLPYFEGYDVIWYLDNNVITNNRSENLVNWDKNSGRYSIYCNPTTITYSITYTLNGGVNDTNNAKSYNIESADFIINDPIRTGYTFLGWTGTNLENTTKAPNISTGTYGELEFSANWSLNSYSITYVLNSGTNALKNPSSYTIEDTISLKDAKKEYYTFDGWYKEQEFINKVETLHGQFGDLVLYAMFTPYTYQSSFDANDGQIKLDIFVNYCNENNDVNKVSITNGQNVNLYSDIEIPSRNGYIFAGWYLDSNYENKVPSEFYLTQDTNIYAKWQAFNSSSEYLRLADKGISAFEVGCDSSSRTTRYFYVPFTYTGKCSLTYLFTGTSNYGGNKESASSTGYITDVTTGKSIFSNTSYEYYSGTTTLQLTPGHCYEIYVTAGYIPSGSSSGRSWHSYQASCSLKLVPIENEVSTLVCKNEFSQLFETNSIIISSAYRDGYDFAGWYDENNELIHDTWDYTENKNFHAEWTIHNYSVTYNLNGGVNNSSNPSSFIYSDYIELLNPQRDGYTFDGWYTNSTFSNKTINIDGSKYSDVELFAKWISNTYTVNLNYDGGQNCPTINFYSQGIIIKTVDLFKNSTLDYFVPESPNENSKFGGWYTDSSCTQLFSFDGIINTDTNLYAKWIDVSSYPYSQLGKDVEVQINGNNYGYIAICSPINQKITITSSSGLDLYGAIYDSNWNVIASCDDISGENLDFSITITLEAGKIYYIGYKANQLLTSGNCIISISGTNSSKTFITGDYTQIIESVNVTYDSSFELPTPKKEGYEFIGWFDENGKLIETSSWNYTENITIYAHWRAI